jgi:phage protein D
MTAASIAKDRDFYVPTFEVRLEDAAAKLPQGIARDITQVTYRDSLDGIDGFDFTINNWDITERAFKYSESDLFNPGRKLALSMGYHGHEPFQVMINGEITSCRPSFPASGQPTLTVSGQSTLLRRLQKTTETKEYPPLTDSQIAKEVARRLNFDLRTDPTAEAAERPNEQLTQENEPALVFLLKRARSIDYELVVEEPGPGKSRLYFGPTAGISTVVYKLAYGSTLTEFQPALDTTDQISEVIVFGWDPINKKPINVAAKRAELNITAVGTAADQKRIEKAFEARVEEVHDASVRTVDEAKRRAIGVIRDNAKSLLISSGTVVGLADLRAGVAVEIDKVGPRYQGRYFLTATTHTIGTGGYTTQFECRHE